MLILIGAGLAAAAALWAGCFASPAADAPIVEPSEVAADPAPEPPTGHPLRPVLEWLRASETHMEENLRDYSATLYKQERIDGGLWSQTLFVKVRHRPFSVYVTPVDPENPQAEEGVYVEGRNGGKLLGHTSGFTGRLLGTVALDPQGTLAMQNQHYPITTMGVLNLCRRIIAVAESDLRYDDCEVRFLPEKQRVEGRACTCVEIVHPVRRPHFRFHLARVYRDDELKAPVRYEAYDWPAEEGAAPPLIEQYAYADIEPNKNLGDTDFDVKNPAYKFAK